MNVFSFDLTLLKTDKTSTNSNTVYICTLQMYLKITEYFLVLQNESFAVHYSKPAEAKPYKQYGKLFCV